MREFSYEAYYTRSKFPFYFWRIKPVLKQSKLRVLWPRLYSKLACFVRLLLLCKKDKNGLCTNFMLRAKLNENFQSVKVLDCSMDFLVAKNNLIPYTSDQVFSVFFTVKIENCFSGSPRLGRFKWFLKKNMIMET